MTFNQVTKMFFVSICFFSSGFAMEIDHLRNQRYCEIFISDAIHRTVNFDIYNTIGLNDCPKNLWDSLTPQQVKDSTGSRVVYFNGPRYWVIDGIKNASIPNVEKKNFGGIEMRQVAVIPLHRMDALSKEKAYEPRIVKRDTTWVYLAGKPVYELVDPEGNVYMMQSYSVQKIHQTEESLKNLPYTLNLPQRWKFHIRNLEQNFYLTPNNNLAVVIQDDFLNTYQQVP